MLNLIMISLLLGLITDFFRKKRRYDTLNCGIFAWVGTAPDKFNPFMFNTLGVYNDSRGGDSCGVYFNRGLIHGIGTEAKYEDLVKSQKLHTTIKLGKWPIAIGHCRKASSGGVSGINIQPVEVRRGESEKLSYIQAHNGTITNHKDLADKYKVKCAVTESDSVVMARVIDKVGFSALAEYEGSAALVMHFIKEPNSIYAFHGESKSYNIVQEERPLHYVQIPNMGTYISSEARPLEFIANGIKATSFKFNVLYKLTGDEVEEVQTIKREIAVQKKYTQSASNHTCGYSNDNWKDKEEWDPYLRKWVPVKSKQQAIEFRDTNKSSTNLVYSNRGVTANICCSTIDAEMRIVGNDTKITYEKGLYFSKTVLAHGRQLVDSWGWKKEEGTKTSLQRYVLYFYYGILVTGKQAFDDIDNLCEQKNVRCAADFFRTDIFNEMESVLIYYAVFPFTRRCFTPNAGFMTPTAFFPNEKGKHKETYYCGEFQPLFSTLVYEFDNGDFEGYSKKDTLLTLDKFLKECEYFADTEFAQTLEEEQKALREDKDRKVEKEKSDNDVVISDCTDCTRYGLDENNSRCFTCEIEFGAFTVGDIRKYDEEKAKLQAHLLNNLTPIIDDMEQLSGEMKEKDIASILTKEYDVLISTQTKLKELIS